MERIPRDFIDSLINRVDIVELIDARVTLKKKSANNYFACCPFHTEKSASFSVSQNKQFFYCFGCGAHGNAVDFLMQYDRLSFPEAIESLAQSAGMEVPKEAQAAPAKTAAQKNLYDLLLQVSAFYQSQLKQTQRAITYLKERGITGEIAKEFAIGFAPSGWDHVHQAFSEQTHQLTQAGMLIHKDEGGYYDRFRDRIMFPIHDRRGRIIGFGGRIIDQGEPKYLNSPETPLFQKGHELYGLFQTLKKTRDLTRILVVEGYLDVIALFQHQITYAVATLGTATSDSHINRLFKHTSEIIFCFDGDKAGLTAASRALQVTLPLMHDGKQVRFMFLPNGEDPDSLVRKIGKSDFETLMLQASTISDFFFTSLIKQTDMSSTDGRARFVKLATDTLNALPESIFQTLLWDELAKRARINIEHIKPSANTTYKKPTQFRKPTHTRPPSPLRFALTLLIQFPKLSQYISEPLPDYEMKGYDILKKVFNQIKTNPNASTGSLLEHWRDTPEESILVSLAQTEYMISESELKAEFLAAMNKLHQLNFEELIEALLSKAASIGLTTEEKLKLSHLIQTKKELP